MSELVDYVKKQIEYRVALADDDPEVGHGMIDDLCESVVRAVAGREPGSAEAASLVANLLQREEDDKWGRWYA